MKDLILKSIQIAQARGYTIGDCTWISERERTCCPLGACLLVDGIDIDPTDLPDYEGQAAELLGWSRAEVAAFTLAFDGNAFASGVDEIVAAFELGREVRGFCGLTAGPPCNEGFDD